MTLAEFIKTVWALGYQFLNIRFPLFEYSVSFFELLIFTTVGGMLMGFFWTIVLHGQGED